MLKSLELFGFKSFADRTKFEFCEGLTGVVGPNGSGKSNVVDAVKWILGDQSAKSLRGKEMSDVIFNGAVGRKASNFAEATITFDNSSGLIPIEMQEVRIGRRLWKNGDAEYLLNNNSVRLKDIRNLLMGTGAGSAAYCIIEQGRVDQILQANASSRRAIFEEAAGISRYKTRKIEATRRLERVEQNLVRLTDIVDELDSQLSSMRNQAEKAAKYREISTELKELWVGLAADDYRALSKVIKERETELQSNSEIIEKLNSTQKVLEKQLHNIDEEIGQIEIGLSQAEKKRSANREKLINTEATVRHQISREEEVVTEFSRLQSQLTMTSLRTNEMLVEQERTAKQLEQFQEGLKGKQEILNRQLIELTEKQSDAEEKKQELSSKRGDLFNVMKELSNTESLLESINNQQIEFLNRIEEEIQLLEDSQDILNQLQEKWGDQSEKVKRVKKEVSHAQKNFSDVDNDRETLLKEQDEYKDKLAIQREQRSAQQARIHLLEDLENRQEGIGIGVQEILKRAKKAKSAPWKQIRGTVAELIDVDMLNAALLEVALGDRAQLIVIDELSGLIDYLNSGVYEISGRVGFLQYSPDELQRNGLNSNDVINEISNGSHLESFQIRNNVIRDLSDESGVLYRADNLVSSISAFPKLGELLLSDTWVVESLDVAYQLSQTIGKGCRFVTLQGEMLDSDGALYVGTLRFETAIVSRKSELRKIRNDLIKLDREIILEEDRLLSISTDLQKIEEEKQECQEEVQKITSIWNEEKEILFHLKQDLKQQEKNSASIEEKINQQKQSCEELKEKQKFEKTAFEQNSENLAQIKQEIHELEQSLLEGESEIEQLKKGHEAENLDFAKKEERVNGIQYAYQRMEEEQKQRVAQNEELVRRISNLAEKKSQLQLGILNERASVSELSLLDETLTSQTDEFIRARNIIRDKRNRIRKEETQVRQERREKQEVSHQAEIELGQEKLQIKSLEERIEEEYQLSLAEVINSGASAYKRYLNDQSVSTEENQTEEAMIQPSYEEVREEIEQRVFKLRKKLKHMGSINSDSLRDLDELESRFNQLNTQLQDLVEAKNALEEIVRRINTESEKLFVETFDNIRVHFQELFRKAFGGGNGDIVLEDMDDVLECGIDIVARPPGKELKSISLMSGGEKTLTAFALLLALFRSRSSTYCLLDEVDAALDEANVGRLLAMLEEFKKNTQFIMITHKKPSMATCDLLYGVTMEQSGVSKKMSVRFDQVNEHGEFEDDSSSNQKAA